MAMWNPWRGCKNAVTAVCIVTFTRVMQKRNVDTNKIVKTKDFDKPVQKLKTVIIK